jgi:hypothetical protein
MEPVKITVETSEKKRTAKVYPNGFISIADDDGVFSHDNSMSLIEMRSMLLLAVSSGLILDYPIGIETVSNWAKEIMS